MSSDSPDTRSRILDSALKLLETGSGSGVRMSDIAKAAGVSRQAVYLHFPKRSDLLVAATRYLDETKRVDERLAASRNAATGTARLDAFIDAWGGYIPEIYGVAKALLAMRETDEAARLAWDDRMQAVRHGCRAAIQALKEDGSLCPRHSTGQATDILWTLLSVRNWEHLTVDCGWSQARYLKATKLMARQMLVAGES